MDETGAPSFDLGISQLQSQRNPTSNVETTVDDPPVVGDVVSEEMHNKDRDDNLPSGAGTDSREAVDDEGGAGQSAKVDESAPSSHQVDEPAPAVQGNLDEAEPDDAANEHSDNGNEEQSDEYDDSSSDEHEEESDKNGDSRIRSSTESDEEDNSGADVRDPPNADEAIDLEALRLVNPRPLPKGARFQSCSDSRIREFLSNVLRPDEFQAFAQTCFGLYLRIKDCAFQGMVYRCIREHQVIAPSPDELWIRVNDQLLKFTIREFAIITGLKCDTDEDDFDFSDQPNCRLMERYFPGREAVSKSGLLNAFKRRCFGTNLGDAVKFAVLVFINSFILSLPPDNLIPTHFFHIVDSERYPDFPWGKYAFRELMNQCSQPLDTTIQHARVFGFPYALQIWIYECCVHLPENIAEEDDEENCTIPRIINWTVKDHKLRYKQARESLFEQSRFINFRPTANEEATFQLLLFHSPCSNISDAKKNQYPKKKPVILFLEH